MRIVTESFLKQMASRYPQATEWLVTFQKSCKSAKWKNIVELRRVYPHADLVKVKSGRSVIVLNAAGNKYRMLIAAHFDRKTIFTLRFIPHAEYSKEHWKHEL